MSYNDPITSKQEPYLIKLLTIVGKEEYQNIKADLGISADVIIPQLTKGQAAGLIREMILAKNRRGRRQ